MSHEADLNASFHLNPAWFKVCQHLTHHPFSFCLKISESLVWSTGKIQQLILEAIRLSKADASSQLRSCMFFLLAQVFEHSRHYLNICLYTCCPRVNKGMLLKLTGMELTKIFKNKGAHLLVSVEAKYLPPISFYRFHPGSYT